MENYKFDVPLVVNITRMVDPPHVGSIIRDEIEERGMTIEAAAQALKTPRSFLSALLTGKRPLSTEMALRIEKAFGLDAELIVSMYHEWEASEMKKNPPAVLAEIERIPLPA